MKIKKRYKLYFINIMILIIVGVFCFSIYRYLQLFYFKEASKKVNEKLIEEVIKETDSSKEGKETSEFVIDFQKLKEINKDVVGWIYIPKTKINYPIVQREDNWYYLNHDIYQKYNILGSIYMNAYNQNDFSDENTILFGHNNHQDHLMFTDLKEVYDGLLGEELLFISIQKQKLTFIRFILFILLIHLMRHH